MPSYDKKLRPMHVTPICDQSVMFILLILFKYNTENPPTANGIGTGSLSVLNQNLSDKHFKNAVFRVNVRSSEFIEGFHKVNYLDVLYQ